MSLEDRNMTLEQVLSNYHDLIAQATELRLAMQSIKEQLETPGTPEWAYRANRAYQIKAQRLIQVKEELKGYRALLHKAGELLAR
jgi:hypothetical protein